MHSELLTARAVQQLHDPEAVVQQGFGPHQLQAQPWGTQERQHCFHLGAHLHILEGRKLVGPRVSEETGHTPRGLWRGCPTWSCAKHRRRTSLPVLRRPVSNFSPSCCRCQVSGREGVPLNGPPPSTTQSLLFSHHLKNDYRGQARQGRGLRILAVVARNVAPKLGKDLPEGKVCWVNLCVPLLSP